MLPAGYSLRDARPSDAALVSHQREAMFVEMGQDYREDVARFTPWVGPKLASGLYQGWFVEHAGTVVAGAGLLFIDWPPHTLDPQPLRAYLLNVYVQPDHRGQGLARALTERAIQETRARGIRILSLHASDAGRPVYTGLGFTPTNEMRLLVPAEVPA